MAKPESSIIPAAVTDAVDAGTGLFSRLIGGPWRAVKGVLGNIFSLPSLLATGAIAGIVTFAPEVSRRIAHTIGGDALADKLAAAVKNNDWKSLLVASAAGGAVVGGTLGGAKDALGGAVTALGGDASDGLESMTSGVITMATVVAVAMAISNKIAVSDTPNTGNPSVVPAKPPAPTPKGALRKE